MRESRQFKNYFIYPSFQWKVIVLFMLVSLISPLILVFFQLQLFQEQMKSGELSNLPDTHPYFTFLKSFQEQFLVMFGFSVLASFVICFFMGLLVSHKVAGPLVKIRNYFDRVGDGEPEKEISFREGDFFQDVAAAYNRKFKR